MERVSGWLNKNMELDLEREKSFSAGGEDEEKNVSTLCAIVGYKKSKSSKQNTGSLFKKLVYMYIFMESVSKTSWQKTERKKCERRGGGDDGRILSTPTIPYHYHTAKYIF